MPAPHPFRFGILAEHVQTREQLLGTARRAEETGYATLLIRDHFLPEPFGHQLAPLAALATVAAHTTTLRVGSLVFANDYRPPVMLAHEAATLDLLSGGRFELGLGTGFLQAEYDRAGLSLDPPGARVTRFAASLRALKALFADGPVPCGGEHGALAGVEGFPRPVQRPHPPILVGAGGRRMLELAAREADIIGLLTTSTANGVLSTDPSTRLAPVVARQLSWIRAAAGARLDALELSLVVSVVVDADRRRAAAEFARARGWDGICPEDVLAMPSVFIGSPEQIVEEMHARRERYGFSYYVISDRGLETAAPLVARLAGR